MSEKLELNILGEQKTLEVRTGAALPLKEPKVVSISGDINTISNYLRKRRDESGHSTQGVYLNKAIVYTDKANRNIRIDVDPENPYGATVKGSLMITDELKQFGINTNQQFSREILVKLLRFTRRFFKSSEVHLNILTSYQAFKATGKTEHVSASDTRGNKTQNFNKEVDSNLPVNFVLSLPIFKGEKNEDFMVEICLELTDAGAHFWFESPELEELISIRTDEIFDAQLKEFEDLVIVNI